MTGGFGPSGHRKKHDMSSAVDHDGDWYDGLGAAAIAITAANAVVDTATMTAAIAAAVAGLHWQDNIDSFVNFVTTEPGAPSVGDRYINTTTGVSSGTAQSMTATYIYEWNGMDWTENIPNDGWAVIEDGVDPNIAWIFSGVAWGDFSSMLNHASLLNLNWDVANHIINIDFDLNTHKAINMTDGVAITDGATLGQIPTLFSDLTNDGGFVNQYDFFNPTWVRSILNTPPGLKSNQEAFLVGTSPTGAWVGSANHVAIYDEPNDFWILKDPSEIGIIYDLNTAKLYQRSGSVWIEYSATDVSAIHNNIVAEISAIAGKTTPVDADVVVMEDSTDGTPFTKKSLTWANLKATLKTANDLIYEPIFSKNTAFNKNFGTGTTDIPPGDHTHTHTSTTGKTANDHHAKYLDSEAQAAVQYQPDVALAGVAPVYADLTTASWADGDRGHGIGTGGREFLMIRRGVAVKYVELF